jgi:CheY-like chemotaxis protein
MDNLRAVLIDDSPEVLEFVIDQVLRPYGFHVETAVDGLLGLRKALTMAPDLVIMDFEMPKLTGMQVLRELRRRNRTVPIILMTSHRSEQIAVEIFHLGVQDFIMKPFTPDELRESIDHALSVPRLEREREQLDCQVRLLNQQREQYLQELNALYYISKSMTGLIPMRTLLERIVDTVLFVTRSEECVLALLDPEMGQLKGQLVKRRPVEADSEVISLPRQVEAKEPDGARHNPGHAPTESVLSVPLQVGQKVVGTLSITKQVTGEFTWQDDRLLRVLADYAAIAVYNFHLTRQLQLNKGRQLSRA